MSMPRVPLVSFPLVLLLSACTWTTVRPLPPSLEALAAAEPSGEVAALAAPVPARPVPVDRAGDPIEPLSAIDASGAPRMHLHDLVNISPESAGLVFAPVTQHVEQCHSGVGGLLRISFSTSGDHSDLEVLPEGSTVDKETRQCVLEALSVLDLSTVYSSSGNPSDNLPGIASQITLQW